MLARMDNTMYPNLRSTPYGYGDTSVGAPTLVAHPELNGFATAPTVGGAAAGMPLAAPPPGMPSRTPLGMPSVPPGMPSTTTPPAPQPMG